MLVLKLPNGYYFHKKGKIILFNSADEAQYMLNGLLQYSINRKMQEQQRDPFAIMEIQQTISQFALIEKDFQSEPECGTINFSELGI